MTGPPADTQVTIPVVVSYVMFCIISSNPMIQKIMLGVIHCLLRNRLGNKVALFEPIFGHFYVTFNSTIIISFINTFSCRNIGECYKKKKLLQATKIVRIINFTTISVHIIRETLMVI